MTNLSPAALAVLDAAYKRMDENPHNEVEATLAAALRTAAEIVVPDQEEPASSPHMGNFVSNAQWRTCQAIRTRLLAIAAELESGT